MEPIDFEAFILKNRTLIQNDPHRELLLYPNDDVSVSRSCWRHTFTLFNLNIILLLVAFTKKEVLQPKKFRTVHSNIPGHGVGTIPSVSTTASVGGGSLNGSSKQRSETGSTTSGSVAGSQNGTPTSNRSLSISSVGAAGAGGGGVATGLLLTRQALHTYESPDHLIHYKYSKYGASWYDLPR